MEHIFLLLDSYNTEYVLALVNENKEESVELERLFISLKNLELIKEKAEKISRLLACDIEDMI